MKTICTAFICILVILSVSGSVDAKKIELKWGSTSAHSGLYDNTKSIRDIVNNRYKQKIAVTVIETEGFADNLMMINRKTIDLSSASAIEASAAYQGLMEFKNKPITDLRSLWGGYITPIHIITTVKSGVTSIAGLDGLAFAMNPKTSSGKLLNLFLGALGIKPAFKDFSIASSVDALKLGVVKVWYKAGYKDKAIVELEALMDINILPITQEMINKINAVYPGYGLSISVPAGLYRALKHNQLSFSYVVSDFVHRDLPADIVYKIVKSVWEKRWNLVNNQPTLKKGRFAEMYQMAIDYDLKVPFHAGAARFYKEKLKLTIPQKLLPPEMKSPKPVE